ncbi:phage tail protein (plasmid) [Haloferax sp. S1W]|uniref:phage tail protein n=1 Tax=Haloferax sp. S1W TaxID=3377110 RepID=UPI0037C8091B
MSKSQPIANTQFDVELDGTNIPGVVEVKLPEKNVQTHNYREGTDMASGTKHLGEVTYTKLEFARTADNSNSALDDWLKAAEEGREKDAKKQIAVLLKDRTGKTVARYNMEGAMVIQYSPPTLNATPGGDQIAVETFVVDFDMMQVDRS